MLIRPNSPQSETDRGKKRFRGMPTFFLHLHEHAGTVTTDEEGSDLADLAAAVVTATAAARGIICHEALEGRLCTGCFVLIEDADHAEVGRIFFADAVTLSD